LNTDYFHNRPCLDSLASTVVYTGKIDEYFNYKFGQLEYRGLRFKTRRLNGDFQGNAVVNYTEQEIPYTRIVEHKHFEFKNSDNTVVTWEYPDDCNESKIPCYPVNDVKNNRLYNLYKQEADKYKNLVLGGRLATYSYLDMDQVIDKALTAAENFQTDR